MAIVTGYTAARMAAIEAASVVDGEVIGDDLILTRQDDTSFNAGNVRGPAGIGHNIEDEGLPLTARAKLNFVGAGVTVTDDSDDGASVVTIGGTTTPVAGYLLFSAMAGADDDAKLATAVSTVSAMTYKPAVVLDENRLYTFNDQHPDPPHGWHLTGPIGGFASNIEQGSANSLNAEVKINYSGTWVNLSVTKWNLRFSNINFEGTSSSVFLNSPTQTLWCMHLSSLAFQLFDGILGSAASKCLMTSCWIDGYWDVANGYDTQFHLGGSDNNLFMNGLFLDSGITAGVVDGTPLIKMAWMTKSFIGPVYCTSQNNWTGLHVDGSTSNGPGLTLLPGGRWEGKNRNEPCRGAPIRIDGGSLTMLATSVNYGMYATNARGDAGTIHQAGGSLAIIGANHARTNGLSQDVPFVYSEGGDLTVMAVQRSTQDGSPSWTDYPVVDVGDGGNLLHADASVRIEPINERPVRVYSGSSAPTNPRTGDLHFPEGA